MNPNKIIFKGVKDFKGVNYFSNTQTTLLLACSLAFASAAVIIVSDEALAAEFEDCVELFGGKEEQEAKINREEFDCVLGACKKQAKCATCMGEVKHLKYLFHIQIHFFTRNYPYFLLKLKKILIKTGYSVIYFDLIFPIQSSASIKLLNFGSSLKKCKKKLKMFIFHLKIDFYG